MVIISGFCNSGWAAQCLPSVEPAGKVGDVAKPSAPQNACRDRAAIAALAMHDS